MFWPGGSGRVGQDHRPRAGVCWPVVDEGGGHTISPSFWMNHYVTSTDPVDVARAIKRTGFASRGETAELAHFSDDRAAPNILISPGSGGHAYVFAELAYLMHLAGYSVFIMPAHGGRTVDQLLVRHRDALDYIATEFNDTIAAYGEGLGGYVVFYLALAHASAASCVRTRPPSSPSRPTTTPCWPTAAPGRGRCAVGGSCCPSPVAWPGSHPAPRCRCRRICRGRTSSTLARTPALRMQMSDVPAQFTVRRTRQLQTFHQHYLPLR